MHIKKLFLSLASCAAWLDLPSDVVVSCGDSLTKWMRPWARAQGRFYGVRLLTP